MGLSILEPPIIANLAGTAAKPAGAVDLTGYPRLTYAPHEYGAGIRLASSGEPVTAIVSAADWADLIPRIEGVCRSFNLTWDELFDALRYARDKGPL